MADIDIGDIFYRCEANEYIHPCCHVKIEFTEYEVIKLTPKGIWINKVHFPRHEKKFVLLSARKRYAYETKKQALYAFIKRKERHIELAELNLEFAKITLIEAKKMYKENNYVK